MLIDTGVLKDYTPHPLAVVWATPVAGELAVATTTRPTFHQAVQYMQPRPLPDAFIDRMYDDYDRPTRCALLRYYRSIRDATFTNSNALADKQAAALRDRRRPALVIWGGKDPYIPSEQAYKQRAVFPGAEVHVFADSGHWPFVDNADKTRALVVPFLRPKLTAISASARGRRVRVAVRVRGVLAAHEVVARIGHAASSPQTVAGVRGLALRVPEPLRPGLHRVTVTALGLPARHVRFRVAAHAPAKPATQPHRRGPRFTG